MLERLGPSLVPEDRVAFYDALSELGAPSREATNLHFAVIRDYIQRFLVDEEIQSVLELGCGEGLLTVQYSGLTSQITGIDLSSMMIGACPELSNASFLIGDIEDPACPIWDMHYDLVIAAGVLPRLLEPRAVLARALRVASWCLISCPVNEQVNLNAFNLDRYMQESVNGDASGHIWAMDDDGFWLLCSSHEVVEFFGAGPCLAAMLRGEREPAQVTPKRSRAKRIPEPEERAPEAVEPVAETEE